MSATQAGFELVDHTAEQSLRLRAADVAGLVEQATLAFASLVPPRLLGDPLHDVFEATLDEADPVATIVGWLNELVFMAEAERRLLVEPRVEPLSGPTQPAGPGEAPLSVRARVAELREPFVLVKAATFHGARVRRVEGGGLEIDITLDL